jgi:hypothetical protein
MPYFLPRTRSPLACMTVSVQSRRPPISDSQSQIADFFDVLALVERPPVMRECDRFRSRCTRIPLASRPGILSQPVSASSCRLAPSNDGAESNTHPSNRNGYGTSIPARSRQPTIAASRKLIPWNRPDHAAQDNSDEERRCLQVRERHLARNQESVLLEMRREFQPHLSCPSRTLTTSLGIVIVCSTIRDAACLHDRPRASGIRPTRLPG